MKTRKFLVLTWCFRSYYKIEVLVDSGKKVYLKVSAVTSWNIYKVKIFVTLASSRLLFNPTMVCKSKEYVKILNLELVYKLSWLACWTSIFFTNLEYVSRMILQYLNEGRNVKAKFKSDIWPESKVAL